MRRTIALLLMCLIPAGPAAAGGAESPWEKEGSSDGITVYTRSREDTERKDIRAVIRLDYPAGKLLDTVTDTENAARWMYRLQAAKSFTIGEEEEKAYYFHWSIPWPFADRYALCRQKIQRDTGSGTIRAVYISIPKKLKNAEAIRIDDFQCSWHIQPAGDGTELMLSIHISPDGLLPAWFANYILKKICVNSLEGLRDYMAAQTSEDHL